MASVKQSEKNYKLAALTTIAVFCMGQIPGSIDAAISKISIYFNLTATTGLYVTTVASIVSVLFSILLGFIAGKKIGFKPLILMCATVELISSILPFFTENFVFILILRGFFGIGFGGMMSMENTVATVLITPEKRASVLGMGTFFGFGMNCLLQFLGGILADKGWNYVFLNHLLLIIPYVIILIGCSKMDFDGQNEEGHEEAGSSKEKYITGPVLKTWILMLFVGIVIAPLLIGCSFLSEPINDSASVAGIVAVCFSVGCMIGGATYPKTSRVLKSKGLNVFLILIIIGLVGCGITRNIVMLCVWIFIAGIGFTSTQATCMMILGIKVKSDKIAFASAIMMALFNFGMFFSSTFENIIGSICGDALYMPLYIGAVIMAAFDVLYLMMPPVKDADLIPGGEKR